MSESMQDISYLRTFEQVSPDYEHFNKLVKPGEALVARDVYLKWYDIYRDGLPIPSRLVDEARSFLLSEIEAGKLALKDEVGFVVHHRCAGAYILYISTWRNENELWETLYLRDPDDGSEFRQIEREATTGTFCVWVLGVVWHEMQAWRHYLYSERDDTAKYAYVRDMMTGVV